MIDPESVFSFVRMLLPLVCIIVAAHLFFRVGMINIAIDGQVLACSAIYVFCLVRLESTPTAVLASIAFAVATGGLLVKLSLGNFTNSILVSFGMLYFLKGAASAISNLSNGKPGNTPKPLDMGLGEWTAWWLCLAATALALLSIKYAQSLRLSKVIGDNTPNVGISFRRFSGIESGFWRHVNCAIGSTLIAIAAIYLTEHGGSFTKNISGERGFLALAVLSLANRSMTICVFVAAGIILLQGLGTRELLPNEIAIALPFAVAFGIVVLFGWRDHKKFSDPVLDQRIK